MVTAKARIKSLADHEAVVPVVLPDLAEVRRLAEELHGKGRPWSGEAFGWQAEYHPESSQPPIDSKMTFTPADFCIGESGVWFFSLMWEQGRDAPAIEFLDDRNILARIEPDVSGRPR